MRDETIQDWHQRVDRTVGLLLHRLDDPPGLVNLAAEMASSPYHFHRMFRALTGETVGGCVSRLRLERAGYLLQKTSLDITTLALETGFASSENLARAFRNSWGMTPSSFRNLPQADWRRPSPAGIHYPPLATKMWHFRLSGAGATPMETKIISLPAWRLAGLKHIGDYWELANVWPRFHALAQQQDLFHPDGPVMCTFLDPWDIPEAERRSYPSVVLRPGCEQVASPLEILDVPGGLYACTPHFGSYETIGESWMRWRDEWLPASGWVLDSPRPSFEWYQNHPRNTPPELLLTLLCDAVKTA